MTALRVRRKRGDTSSANKAPSVPSSRPRAAPRGSARRHGSVMPHAAAARRKRRATPCRSQKLRSRGLGAAHRGLCSPRSRPLRKFPLEHGVLFVEGSLLHRSFLLALNAGAQACRLAAPSRGPHRPPQPAASTRPLPVRPRRSYTWDGCCRIWTMPRSTARERAVPRRRSLAAPGRAGHLPLGSRRKSRTRSGPAGWTTTRPPTRRRFGSSG